MGMYNETPDFSGTLVFENGSLTKVLDKKGKVVQQSLPPGTFKGLATITLLHTEGSAWCTIVFMGKCYTVPC